MKEENIPNPNLIFPIKNLKKQVFKSLAFFIMYVIMYIKWRCIMKAMNATKARANLFKIMAFVNDNSQPLTLTNSKGKNAVLIGEDDWNAIQETMYLNSVPGMTESLIKGKNTPLEECLSEDEVEW